MTFALGIAAALSAPLTMTVGFIVWDNHWTGSAFALNLFKCNLASIGFVILSLSTRSGTDDIFFPSKIFTFENVGFLVLSSTIGIIIGDWTWLEGLRLLGARKVIVMDSLKPFLAALFGWAFLDERLKLAALGGIALTVTGILLVSLETEGPEETAADETTQQSDPNNKSQKVERNVDNQTPIIKSPNASTTTSSSSTPPETETEAEVSSELTIAPKSLAKGSFQQPASPESNIVIVDENKKDVEHQTTAEANAIELKLEPFAQPQDPQQGSKTTKMPQQSPTTSSSTNASKRAKTRWELQRGYLYAILNVVLDTYGSVLTKEYGEGMTTWEINLIRFGFAGLFMLACSIGLTLQDRSFGGTNKSISKEGATQNTSEDNGATYDVDQQQQQRQQQLETQSDPRAMKQEQGDLWYRLPFETMTKASWMRVCCGVLFVTFFTPALSNYALFQVALALALTLGSAGPLYALPLTFFMQKDQQRPTLRAWMGAGLAVGGIVVLAFWGQQDE